MVIMGKGKRQGKNAGKMHRKITRQPFVPGKGAKLVERKICYKSGEKGKAPGGGEALSESKRQPGHTQQENFLNMGGLLYGGSPDLFKRE